METPQLKNQNQELPRIDIADEVLKKIEKRKIKMTDRWVFWAKKLGLGSGLILTSIILVFVINLIFYYFQKNGSLFYLSFGQPALGLVLGHIPFAFIAVAIILWLFINFIINKTVLVYKKSYPWLRAAISLIIIGAGMFIFFSGVNKVIEGKLAQSQKRIFLLSEIYKGQVPCLSADKSGVIGKITEINIDSLTIQTLNNQTKINIYGPADQISTLAKGETIVAIGTNGQSFFAAETLKKVTPEMIKKCYQSAE